METQAQPQLCQAEWGLRPGQTRCPYPAEHIDTRYHTPLCRYHAVEAVEHKYEMGQDWDHIRALPQGRAEVEGK